MTVRGIRLDRNQWRRPVKQKKRQARLKGSVDSTARFVLGPRESTYSVGVFSEGNNGIVAFNNSWKNVVATFYHELVEARTDADVEEGRVAWVNNEESVRPLSRAKPVWETGRAIPLSVLDTKAACSRWSSAKPNWPKSLSCARATAHATQKAAVRRHPQLLPEGDRLPRQPRQSDERSPARRRFEYGTDPAHVVECNQRARGSDSGSALRRLSAALSPGNI